MLVLPILRGNLATNNPASTIATPPTAQKVRSEIKDAVMVMRPMPTIEASAPMDCSDPSTRPDLPLGARPRPNELSSGIQVILGGLLTGCIYALVAVGLALIWGLMGLINFAHGDFLMLGMYISFWAWALICREGEASNRRGP